MGMTYAARVVRRITALAAVCAATIITPIVMLVLLVAINADGQTIAAEVAVIDTVAKSLLNKDITYAALFVAGMSCVITGMLVRVMVQMFREFLNASVQSATAMTKISEQFAELHTHISSRPCQMERK